MQIINNTRHSQAMSFLNTCMLIFISHLVPSQRMAVSYKVWQVYSLSRLLIDLNIIYICKDYLIYADTKCIILHRVNGLTIIFFSENCTLWFNKHYCRQKLIATWQWQRGNATLQQFWRFYSRYVKIRTMSNKHSS